MADALYDAGREGFADGSIQWNATPAHKLILIRGYTFNAGHKFVSDLTAAGATVVSTTAALTSKTATAGVLDAADTLFASVTAGAACTAMVIIQSSAVTGGADVATTAQRVIAYLDSYTGLPVTPNGANINVTFPNDANRILKL